MSFDRKSINTPNRARRSSERNGPDGRPASDRAQEHKNFRKTSKQQIIILHMHSPLTQAKQKLVNQSDTIVWVIFSLAVTYSLSELAASSLSQSDEGCCRLLLLRMQATFGQVFRKVVICQRCWEGLMEKGLSSFHMFYLSVEFRHLFFRPLETAHDAHTSSLRNTSEQRTALRFLFFPLSFLAVELSFH